MPDPIPIQKSKDGKVLPRSRCRKWLLRVSVGVDPKTGKYRYVSRSFPSKEERRSGIEGTWTQAKDAMRDFEMSVESGSYRTTKPRSFEIECAEYLEARRPNVSKRTIEKETFHFKALCMHLGKADVSKISARDVERAYAAMRAGETPSGKPAGGTYLSNMNETLSRFYKRLIRDGKASKNVAELADSPKIDTKPKKALSPDEMYALVERLNKGDMRENMLGTYVTTGLRRSELLAIRRCDVMVDEGLLVFSQAMDEDGSLKETKSGRTRAVPLNSDARSFISARLESQRADFKAAGIPLTDATPLYAMPDGKVMLPHSMTTWMRRNATRLGIEGYTLHELRHTFLTAMSHYTTPDVLSKIAGHSRTSTTLDIYVHWRLEEMLAAAKAMDSAKGDL